MEYTRDLRKGDKGDDVRAVKDRLFALGYYSGSITKITNSTFGADTLQAVKNYQSAAAVPVTGVVDRTTWDLIFSTVPPVPVDDKAAAAAELAWRYIGNPYVWSASGQENPSDAWIKAHDSENPQASIDYIEKKRAQGITRFLAFDCSGFVCFLFNKTGAMAGRTNANGLYGRSEKLAKAELRAGDLLFRGTDAKKSHVGIYAGDGWVVHAKGRAYGVVAEPIDYKSGYWTYYGRFKG